MKVISFSRNGNKVYKKVPFFKNEMWTALYGFFSGIAVSMIVFLAMKIFGI